MFPMALLLHELPDGSSHFDWMLARDETGPLVTFRVADRIDLGVPAFAATRLADHRRIYLTYEGEVSGGRGRVRRVAQGSAAIELDDATQFVARGDFGGAITVWRGSCTGGNAWRFGRGE